MKSKGPPYKVMFGKKDERPPAYVSAIGDGEIFIRGTVVGPSKHGHSRSIHFNTAVLDWRSRSLELIDD